jgi:hypothetical protein
MIKLLKKSKYYLIENEAPYDYLIKMSFYSFSKEKIIEYNNKFKEKNKLYNEIKKKTIEQMYIDDLNILESVIN